MSVYAVHPLNDKDLTPALVYGELIYINNRYIYGDELDEQGTMPAVVTDRMWAAAEAFEPDDDYLLIAGDHLQLVAMSAYLSYECGSFKVLRFDRHAGGYIPVQIDATEI